MGDIRSFMPIRMGKMVKHAAQVDESHEERGIKISTSACEKSIKA